MSTNAGSVTVIPKSATLAQGDAYAQCFETNKSVSFEFLRQIILSICVCIASFQIFEFLRQFWPKWHLCIMSAVVVK